MVSVGAPSSNNVHGTNRLKEKIKLFCVLLFLLVAYLDILAAENYIIILPNHLPIRSQWLKSESLTDTRILVANGRG